MTKCHAQGCISHGPFAILQVMTGRVMALCEGHRSYHRNGIGFELELPEPADEDTPLYPDFSDCEPEPADTVLNTPQGTYILKSPKEAPMAYNSALSTLQSSRDELQEAIEEARNRIGELEDAINDMEGALDSVREAVDALEALDGFSVSVDVEALELYVSIDL